MCAPRRRVPWALSLRERAPRECAQWSGPASWALHPRDPWSRRGAIPPGSEALWTLSLRVARVKEMGETSRVPVTNPHEAYCTLERV